MNDAISKSMHDAKWSGRTAREIAKRIVVMGTLVLKTPAHFGNGDSDEAVISLQTDSIDHTRPLLPGPSIAGALRSYLRKREYGYECAEEVNRDTNDAGLRIQEYPITGSLFGAPLGGLIDNDGEQSRLLVDDALGSNGAKVFRDYRDGVTIDPVSRTAKNQGLYTFQTWGKGTSFNLRFELLILETDLNRENDLLLAFAAALSGLASGEITLGARKKRGFGEGEVKMWQAWHYDMRNGADHLAWLKQVAPGDNVFSGDAYQALDVHGNYRDERDRFLIQARFEINGSLLIRTATHDYTDMSHLTSGGKSVLSGTSAAGVIRARARRIAKTLDVSDVDALVNGMFGQHGDDDSNGNRKSTASRVIIREAVIDGGSAEMVQSRVSIDRFTGGALDTALFNQQPHWGGQFTLKIEIQSPQDREIGLLLLVLKDLWTGDLPLGGESSVGRGRLKGRTIYFGWTPCTDGQEQPDFAHFVKELGLQSYVDKLSAKGQAS